MFSFQRKIFFTVFKIKDLLYLQWVKDLPPDPDGDVPNTAQVFLLNIYLGPVIAAVPSVPILCSSNWYWQLRLSFLGNNSISHYHFFVEMWLKCSSIYQTHLTKHSIFKL